MREVVGWSAVDRRGVSARLGLFRLLIKRIPWDDFAAVSLERVDPMQRGDRGGAA